MSLRKQHNADQQQQQQQKVKNNYEFNLVLPCFFGLLWIAGFHNIVAQNDLDSAYTQELSIHIRLMSGGMT